jgi:hypothetical protein
MKFIQAFRYVVLLILIGGADIVAAEVPIVEIRIRDHLFYPAEVKVPANTKIKLLVKNEDPTPEEFESYPLNREKVILGKTSTILFIGPLAPGVYPFFGEFNISSAQGTILAE